MSSRRCVFLSFPFPLWWFPECRQCLDVRSPYPIQRFVVHLFHFFVTRHLPNTHRDWIGTFDHHALCLASICLFVFVDFFPFRRFFSRLVVFFRFFPLLCSLPVFPIYLLTNIVRSTSSIYWCYFLITIIRSTLFYYQGFAAAGDPRNTASLSDEMKSRGIGMDVVSYGTAVSACAKAGDVKGALKLLKVWCIYPCG